MTDTLLRDLINLPEEVHRGQFVISLEDGVARAEQTLREYVVTDEIEGCFDTLDVGRPFLLQEAKVSSTPH